MGVVENGAADVGQAVERTHALHIGRQPAEQRQARCRQAVGGGIERGLEARTRTIDARRDTPQAIEGGKSCARAGSRCRSVPAQPLHARKSRRTTSCRMGRSSLPAAQLRRTRTRWDSFRSSYSCARPMQAICQAEPAGTCRPQGEFAAQGPAALPPAGVQLWHNAAARWRATVSQLSRPGSSPCPWQTANPGAAEARSGSSETRVAWIAALSHHERWRPRNLAGRQWRVTHRGPVGCLVLGSGKSSASAAGGLMAQSGSHVLVTCRSSIRRR